MFPTQLKKLYKGTLEEECSEESMTLIPDHCDCIVTFHANQAKLRIEL